LVAPHKVDRRSGEGRGKPLDEGITGPIVVENFGGRPMSSSGRLSAEMMKSKMDYDQTAMVLPSEIFLIAKSFW
jgi:hypothetical protein